MKKLIKMILGIVFVPLFLLLVAVFTVKIYFLSPDFWKSVYAQEFYGKITQVLKTQDEEILIDPVVLKDAADKNIVKVIDFLNGKNPDLLVYIPKELDFTFAGGEVGVKPLLDKYLSVDPTVINNIMLLERTSFYVNLVLIVAAILILTIFLIAGRTSGVYLVTGGLSLLLAAGLINFIKIQWVRDLLPKNEGIAVIGIPLMGKVSSLWVNYSIGTLVLGGLVLVLGGFLRKKS